MGVLRQRVGAAQHKRASVQHVIKIEDPRRRHVHDVALEHFDADDGHQQYDQPGRDLAAPRADFVNDKQKFLDGHWSPPINPRKE
jgi:hypothetical protein